MIPFVMAVATIAGREIEASERLANNRYVSFSRYGIESIEGLAVLVSIVMMFVGGLSLFAYAVALAKPHSRQQGRTAHWMHFRH